MSSRSAGSKRPSWMTAAAPVSQGARKTLRADFDQPGAVVHQGGHGVGGLGAGVLGVRVVHVVAGAVGEHGVDQVRLHLGCQRQQERLLPGIVGGRLVVEVPADPLGPMRPALPLERR